jgi:flavin-binding protein dodecin
MNNSIYKSIELTGSSETSPEDAVRKAVAAASNSLKNMRWFQVVDTRGHIDKDEIAHWQVTVKIGFTLDE